MKDRLPDNVQSDNGDILTTLLMTIGLLAWGGVCAVQDMQRKRIANWLTLGFFTLALVHLLVTHTTLTKAPPAQALLALGLAILLSIPGYITGRMGAGDVKMLAALGLATQSQYLLYCVIAAALGMLLWSFCQPLWRRLPLPWRKAFPMMDPSVQAGMPYAPFLFCGMLVSSLVL